MKNILHLFIFCLLLSSCEDVIELETPTGEKRLNIDAHFRIFTDEVPVRIEGNIKLTETVNFFEDNIPTVSNAIVTITERGSNTVYTFFETENNSGIYEASDLIFLNNFDETFDLRIETQDQVFTGSAKPVRSAPIIEIEQGDLEIFGEEDLELKVTISDSADREDYYLFDFGFNLYQPLEDQFFNGNEFQFSFLYTENDDVNLQAGDEVMVINDGIDERFFTYMELLLEQTNGGGLFSNPPATVRGNLINEINPDDFPYGYFRISESFMLNYEVQED
ncbi:MAG: DUF4249 family protein [bacterium]